GVGDAAAGGIAGHGPLMGGLGDPLRELRVEILERGEAARGEERVAEVLNQPFGGALFIAPSHGAGLWGEVVVPRELEQAGVEANVFAIALEDDAFQVVVEEGPRDAAEGGEGLDMAPEKALESLVEGEASVDGAGPGEHEDEAGEDAPGVADLDRAEVAPVDLALLADQRLQAEVGLRPRRGADEADVAPDLHGGAGVAAVAQHGPQARGAQARVLRQGRGDEGLVGIQGAGPNLGAGVAGVLAVERARDGLVMDAEGVGDGADRPVFGVEEAADLGALEQGDHRRPSAPRRRPGAEMGQGDVAEKAAARATAGRARGTSRVWGLGIDDGPLAARRWAQRGGRQGDDAGFPRGPGSLMRHSFVPRPIPGLAGRVMDSTPPALLIAP